MPLDAKTLEALDCSMDENHREMVVLTMEHVMKFALSRSLANAATQPPQLCSRTMSHMLDGVSPSIRTGYGAVVHPTVNTTWAVPTLLGAYDAKNVALLLKDIGGFGTKARISVHKGKEYLILSGHAGLRNKLKGTRYGIGHAQLVDMGIGKYGIRGSSIKGFKISCWVGIGIELGEWLYGDERLWSDLFGGIGVELVKAGIATAIGYAAAVAAGALITAAAAPAIFGALFVFAVGIGLNVLDNHFGIKSAVKSGLRYAVANIEEIREQVAKINVTRLQEYIEHSAMDIAGTLAEGLYEEAKDWVIEKLRPDGLSIPAWPSAPNLPSLPRFNLPRLQ